MGGYGASGQSPLYPNQAYGTAPPPNMLSAIRQQEQPFSIQQEDFPALGGSGGNGNSGMAGSSNSSAGGNNSKTNATENSSSAGGSNAKFSGSSRSGASHTASPPTEQQQQQAAINNVRMYTLQGLQDLLRSSSNLSKNSSSPSTDSSANSSGSVSQQQQRIKDQSMLTLGTDLTALGMNLSGAEPLYSKFSALPLEQGKENNIANSSNVSNLLDSTFNPKSREILSTLLADAPQFWPSSGNHLTTSTAVAMAMRSHGTQKEEADTDGQSDSSKINGAWHIPSCYYLTPPPQMKPHQLSKFQLETLFYVFYAMPKDVLQALAAQELYARQWKYATELKLWFKQGSNTENDKEGDKRSTNSSTPVDPEAFVFFDPTRWESRTVKDAFGSNSSQVLFTAQQWQKNVGFLTEAQVQVNLNAVMGNSGNNATTSTAGSQQRQPNSNVMSTPPRQSKDGNN